MYNHENYFTTNINKCNLGTESILIIVVIYLYIGKHKFKSLNSVRIHYSTRMTSQATLSVSYYNEELVLVKSVGLFEKSSFNLL